MHSISDRASSLQSLEPLTTIVASQSKNFNICNETKKGKSAIIFLAAHKCGSYFKAAIIPAIRNKCLPQNDKKSQRLIQYRESPHLQGINATKKIALQFENQNIKPFFVLMLRPALSTIISGYNYHARGSERHWTDKEFTKSTSRLYCFRNVFNKSDGFVVNKNTSMYKEYKKSFDDSKLRYIHGLYLEFIRFVNCEFPTTYMGIQIFKRRIR